MNSKALILVAIVASASASHAVGLYQYNLDNPTNAVTANLQRVSLGAGRNVSVNWGSGDQTVFAGQTNNRFNGTIAAMLCVELEQNSSTNNNLYTRKDMSGQIGRLINLLTPSLTNDEAAGLQVAVWEIAYDFTGGGNAPAPNLDGGTFQLKTTGAVRTHASNFLNMVAAESIGDYRHYTNDSFQNFISGTEAVPEPATLLGLTVGAASLIARRRARKS